MKFLFFFISPWRSNARSASKIGKYKDGEKVFIVAKESLTHLLLFIEQHFELGHIH